MRDKPKLFPSTNFSTCVTKWSCSLFVIDIFIYYFINGSYSNNWYTITINTRMKFKMKRFDEAYNFKIWQIELRIYSLSKVNTKLSHKAKQVEMTDANWLELHEKITRIICLPILEHTMYYIINLTSLMVVWDKLKN